MLHNKDALSTSVRQAHEPSAPYPTSSNAEKYLVLRALFVVSLALLVGGGIPALLAYNQGVFFQQDEIIIICWLIASIWTQWLSHYRLTCTEFDSHGYVAWSEALHHKTTERLSDTFSRWQLSSLLLVSAFSSFFVFYWRNIHDRGDSRYLPSALSIQVIGIVSWIIISLPLIATWRHWHGLRACAIHELATSSEEVARIDLRNRMIEAVKPIGSWNFLVSSSLLLVSFLSPLIKLMIH
ncbi:MAG TPA: hypothetical protein VF516_13170 [Kofleriaceae bacterium]